MGTEEDSGRMKAVDQDRIQCRIGLEFDEEKGQSSFQDREVRVLITNLSVERGCGEHRALYDRGYSAEGQSGLVQDRAII